MKKLIYTLVILASLFISCGKEDNHINEELPVDDTPEDKTEVQHILITANVRENFKLPVGTRCEAEFYDKDGKKVDCKKTLSAASERSFNIGADLDKGKQYTCLLWFDNGSYGYDISEGLKSVRMSTKPSMDEYNIIKAIYDDISNELELENSYNPAIILNGANNYPYSFRRVLIESLNNSTDVFLSEGELTKQSFVPAPGMAPQINLSDNRIFEGWKHEN